LSACCVCLPISSLTAKPVSVVVAKSCFVRPSASTSNKTFRAAPDQQDPEVWFCPQMMHGEGYQMPGNRHKAKMRGFGAPSLQPTWLGRLRTADPCILGRFALLGQPPSHQAMSTTTRWPSVLRKVSTRHFSPDERSGSHPFQPLGEMNDTTWKRRARNVLDRPSILVQSRLIGTDSRKMQDGGFRGWYLNQETADDRCCAAVDPAEAGPMTGSRET
jgi:hypothetical protein